MYIKFKFNHLQLGFWGFGVLGFWGFGEKPVSCDKIKKMIELVTSEEL